ncbi:hypothetical protein D3C81_2120800 [compost metagenome]
MLQGIFDHGLENQLDRRARQRLRINIIINLEPRPMLDTLNRHICLGMLHLLGHSGDNLAPV